MRTCRAWRPPAILGVHFSLSGLGKAVITSRQVHGEASVAQLGGRGGQRRQQGAAFTPEAMDSYLPRVEATCRAYLDRWARQDCIDVQEEVRQD